MLPTDNSKYVAISLSDTQLGKYIIFGCELPIGSSFWSSSIFVAWAMTII